MTTRCDATKNPSIVAALRTPIWRALPAPVFKNLGRTFDDYAGGYSEKGWLFEKWSFSRATQKLQALDE
jgi:hypothetical protein